MMMVKNATKGHDFGAKNEKIKGSSAKVFLIENLCGKVGLLKMLQCVQLE